MTLYIDFLVSSFNAPSGRDVHFSNCILCATLYRMRIEDYSFLLYRCISDCDLITLSGLITAINDRIVIKYV